MKTKIRLITGVLVSISCTSNYAASTPNGDAVSQAYAMSQTLQTQEHVPGISLIGGQITHSQPVIKGNLPYVMSYVGSVRNSLSASNDYFDQYLTTGGWTDNYQNSVRFIQTDAVGIGVYIIRLPGSRQDVWLRNDSRSTCNGGVLKAFSSDALGRIAFDNGANLLWACSTNGYQFTENSGGGITITYRGSVYKTTSAATSQSGTTYYRIVSVKSPQGKQLNFEYDSAMNMLSVADNRNNKLTFTRNFKAGTTQTAAERRLITQVESTGGEGAKQTASLSYASYNSQDANGKSGSIYYPTSVTSTAFGKNSFDYTAIKQWAIDGYLKFKSIAISNTNAAILTSVKNAEDVVQRQWLVTQNYASYNSNTKTYGTAKVTLQVRTPNGSAYASDYTINYDDNARTVVLSTKPNGRDEGKVTYTITPKPVAKTSVEGVTYYDDGESEITVSDSFPAITIDGNVPKSITMHSWYDYIKKVITAKDLTITQLLDTDARPSTITYAGTGVSTKTISYTYGALANGAVNPYLTPTKITVGSLTVSNILNANGQITKQTQSSSQTGSTAKTTDYVYYTNADQANYGLINTVDGPRSGTADKITYIYDNFGNLISQAQTINGAVITISYIGFNNFALPERIVNPNGLVEQFVYNADGTIKTKTVGVGGSTGAITGQTTTYTYNDLKQLVSEKNPDGDTTSYHYNVIGQPSTVVLPNGNRVAYTYFPIGITASEVQTNSANTLFNQSYTQIDANGRVVKQYSGNDANKLYTSYSYDNNGNLIQTGSAQGIIERWTYDALNRVKTHTDGMDNVDTKDYDNLDNIILAKDAVNAGSSPLTYRNGNVLTQEVNSDFGTKTYTYNEADQLTQRIHSARKCNYNNIDESGRYRVFVCTANSGTAANEYQINDNYTYDQSRFGRLDKVTSSIAGLDVNTNYTYDAYDRIIQKSQVNLLANRWLNTPNQSLNVNYGYSLGGKRTSLTLPSGRVIDYSYNLAASTLTGINLNNSALVRGITYDGANRITGWLWGSSGQNAYSIAYNNNGLLERIANTPENLIIYNQKMSNFSESYTYDSDGRVQILHRGSLLRNAFFYSYDANNRLINETKINHIDSNLYSINYSYDKNGNRIILKATGNENSQPSASVNYAYTGNKLSTLNKGGTAQTLTYTANAEVAFGSYKANYDNGGRRKADMGANHYYYMNYNHKNERITRGYVANNAASNVIQYVYDEESHLIGEYSGATPIVEYVWLGDKPVAAIYGSGAATKIYYIVTDHLNTPRALVDINMAVVWSWDSTAFGLGAPTGSITFNLRFPGQYYDVGTGQFYNHNRFYNPELGRYMEPDPIGLEGGLNPYVYAGNNPVMNTDSTGLVLDTIPDIALAGYSIYSAYNEPTWLNIGAAVFDSAAVIIPFVPAGAGVSVKTTNAAKKSLLSTEGDVGKYSDLIAAGKKGDNITPHHIPSANHMAQHGVSKGDGISINMEQPIPGSGGRHRQTFTYGTQADLGMSSRSALAVGVRDARKIYQKDGLYDAQMREQLQELILQNKTQYPLIFKK